MTVQTEAMWEAKNREAGEHSRRVMDLRRESDELHCPFRLGGGNRCMFDKGHDGDHRLNQWAWIEMPQA